MTQRRERLLYRVITILSNFALTQLYIKCLNWFSRLLINDGLLWHAACKTVQAQLTVAEADGEADQFVTNAQQPQFSVLHDHAKREPYDWSLHHTQ